MQLNETGLREVLSHFDLPGEFIAYTPITYGHINETVRVELRDGGETDAYIVQRINTHVFTDPDALMDNILHVTAFLADKIAESGDASRRTLTVFRTTDGKPYYTAPDGECIRIYNYVRDTYSLQSIENPDDFRKAGEAFGDFQNMLDDYPSSTLHETIAHFHDTASRFADLCKAVERDTVGRRGDVTAEIDFCMRRKADTHVLVDLLAAGKLPLRVTHNDTKLNNILFDAQTHKGVCIVDLDTVMPGLSLYDFGDSIRFGASTAAEDEKDLSKVSMDLDLFKAYADGYLSAAGPCLTETEIAYLPFSAKLMTLECGMRFLTDYLNGDTYFHTDYPTQNLDRCRTHLHLVADMEAKAEQMQRIIAASAEMYCKKDGAVCS